MMQALAHVRINQRVPFAERHGTETELGIRVSLLMVTGRYSSCCLCVCALRSVCVVRL